MADITSLTPIVADMKWTWVVPQSGVIRIAAIGLQGPSGGGGSAGVTSFNTRTGVVTLSSADVTTALAFTPVPPSRNFTAGAGLAGGGDLSADRTLALANTAVTPGSYTNANITVDAQGRITAAASGSAGGSGTVTSVGLTVPAFMNVAGSPVTTAGTITLSLAAQAAKTFLAGPASGANAAPTMRAIQTTDLPATVAYLDAAGQTFTQVVAFSNNVSVGGSVTAASYKSAGSLVFASAAGYGVFFSVGGAGGCEFFNTNTLATLSARPAVADAAGVGLVLQGGTPVAASSPNLNGGDVILQGGAPAGAGVAGSVAVRPLAGQTTDNFKVEASDGTRRAGFDSSQYLYLPADNNTGVKWQNPDGSWVGSAVTQYSGSIVDVVLGSGGWGVQFNAINGGDNVRLIGRQGKHLALMIDGVDLTRSVQVRQAASQTGDVFQAVDSTGTKHVWIDSAFVLHGDGSGLTGLSSAPVTSVNGQTGAVVLAAADVGAQPSNANLTALAGLTGSANVVPYFTGAGTMALAGFTGAAITFLSAATVAAQRTALGLGSVALLNSITSADLPATVVYGDSADIPHRVGWVLARGTPATVGINKAGVKVRLPYAGTFKKVWVDAETGPTGADLIIDIKLNGTSLWSVTTANRPKIANGATSGTQTAFDTASFAAGDYLTIDVAQVGSTVAGQDIAVALDCQTKNQ